MSPSAGMWHGALKNAGASLLTDLHKMVESVYTSCKTIG